MESINDEKIALLEGEEERGPPPMPAWERKMYIRNACFLLFALAVATIIFFIHEIFPEEPAARRALSLFAFVCILWATEALPVYITSMLIPLLIVFMKVLRDDKTGQLLSADVAATTITGSLFTGTVLVALGAFTMSRALSKYDLSIRIAQFVLSRVGNRPHIVMLAVMFLGWVLAMWINNVASPVVIISVVQPMLNDLSPEEPFAKALLLGIAYSNNIAGMTTPIASPQNLVAFHVINDNGDIGWGEFLAVSLPFSIVCIFITFAFLWLFWRPKIQFVDPAPRVTLPPMTIKHYFILAVCIATIVLWAVEQQIESFVGSLGIIALIPVVTFFALPILDKSDFKELSWDILMLLAGGIALGDAIESSGLLLKITQALEHAILHSSEYVVFVCFIFFIWMFANFISHTVAALIILPILAEVGCSIAGGCAHSHFRLLVVGAVLIDSGAMALPVTSFPNAQCFSATDKFGRRYLTSYDFVKTGFLLGLLEVLAMFSLGYALLIGVF